jgi:hypothetical protein
MPWWGWLLVGLFAGGILGLFTAGLAQAAATPTPRGRR